MSYFRTWQCQNLIYEALIKRIKHFLSNLQVIASFSKICFHDNSKTLKKFLTSCFHQLVAYTLVNFRDFNRLELCEKRMEKQKKLSLDNQLWCVMMTKHILEVLYM